MASKDGAIPELVAEERSRVEVEPLLTRHMSVGTHGSNGTSLKHTIPRSAADMLDIEAKDEVEVRVYEDCYVVRRRERGREQGAEDER